MDKVIAAISMVVIFISFVAMAYAGGVDDGMNRSDRAHCEAHGGVLVDGRCFDARAIIPLTLEADG